MHRRHVSVTPSPNGTSMALIILSVAALLIAVTGCIIALMRLRKENACNHKFEKVSQDFDVTFGHSTNFICRNCGRTKVA